GTGSVMDYRLFYHSRRHHYRLWEISARMSISIA
ncbi:hypothetical protein SSYM_0621, partial [Serratia symbiotica str. Tucson]